MRPEGAAIQAREAEENMTPGHLSTLTALNIDLLVRIRDSVTSDLRENVDVGTYDETIRFNLTFIDDQLCIVQPYLPAMRGVDSPTLVIEQNAAPGGLYGVFERVFDWLNERSTPV